MQRLAFVRRQRFEEFAGDIAARLVGVAQERPAVLGQDDDAAAPVPGGGPPFGEAEAFEVVDEADDGARVVAEAGAELPLRGAPGRGEETQERVMAQAQPGLLQRRVEELTGAQADPVEQISGVGMQAPQPGLVRDTRLARLGGADVGCGGCSLGGDGVLPGAGPDGAIRYGFRQGDAVAFPMPWPSRCQGPRSACPTSIDENNH